MGSMREPRFVAPVLTAALALTACGGSREAAPTPSETATAASAVTTGSRPSVSSAAPRPEGDFVFDSLLLPEVGLSQGGSNVITVYAGPQDTAADKQPTGTFEHGQRAQAVCKAVGRLVTSRPDLGERGRQTADWVGIVPVTSPGATVPEWYATLTYGSIDEQVHKGLSPCPSR